MSSIFHKALYIKMSYSKQSNNSNYKIDLSGLSPHYQPQVGNRMQVYSNTMLTSNLDLYIPRVSQGTTEDQIKTVFARSNIGIVDYCDLSLTKDKDTKKPQYLSAFVKLIRWSDLSGACEDFTKNKSIRLYLSYEGSEFWMILPNNNPLPRSHINTSQLAAATDKLFEQTDALEKKAEKFQDEMRAEMAEMRLFMKMQQQSIDVLKTELAAANDDIEQLNTNIEQLVQDNRELTYQLKRSNNAIYGHNTIDEYEAAEEKKRQEKNKVNEDKKLQDQFDAEVDALLDLPLPMMQGVSYTRQMPSLPRTDKDNEAEEFFARPPPMLTRSVSVFQTQAHNEEDECIFSSNTQRRVSPSREERQAQTPIVSSVTLSLPEIVAKNPERAIESRDFCGNC